MSLHTEPRAPLYRRPGLLQGGMTDALAELEAEIAACRACADRFAATETAHAPHPVVRLSAAPILVAGQAPGARVHAGGLPFLDRSGDRLRAWMGLERARFYDRALVSILPMAFCFPGHDARGADLPPPPLCARRWRRKVTGLLPPPALTLLVGGHAQRWHLQARWRGSVTETVRAWRSLPEGVFALPHPSWRNTGWLKRNPWFEAELLPALRRAVAAAVAEAGTGAPR